MLAEWQNKEDNVVGADDLFNAAKAATKARRERMGRSASKRKDVLESSREPLPPANDVEEENFDPMELQTPAPTMKNALKRKSRLIKNRRMTQDHDSEEDKEDSQNDSGVAKAIENNASPRNPQKLKRRATRSVGRVLRESNQEILDDESNIEDSIEAKIMAHERQNKVLTRTNRRTTVIGKAAVASSHSIDEDADAEDDDDIEDLEKIERKIEELKMTRKSRVSKQALARDFEHIRRAPTPVKNPVETDDNLRQPNLEIDAAQVAEEAEMSFHPNVESTRVGAGQIFADSESSTAGSRNSKEPQGSPKASSRKRTASRQKMSESLKYALVNEDDRGSYLAARNQAKKSPEKLVAAPVVESIEDEEEDAQSYGDNGADGYENVEPDSNEENEPEIVDHQEASVTKRQSQELMPPPSSTVIQRATRNRALDSLIVQDEDQLDFSGILDVQEGKSSKGVRRKKVSQKAKRDRSPSLSDTSMKNYFEHFSGRKLGKDGLTALKEGVNEVLDAMDDWLLERTGGLKPQLGDYKDAMEHFQLIEPGESIFQRFHEYLDAEDLFKLFPMAFFDGSVGGGTTMPENAWDIRATDIEDTGDDNFKIYGQKRKAKSKRK